MYKIMFALFKLSTNFQKMGVQENAVCVCKPRDAIQLPSWRNSKQSAPHNL